MPLRGPVPMFSKPVHSLATMNSVRPCGPPRAQENPKRSSGTEWVISPPSTTRTQPVRVAHHTASSASIAMPSAPSATSAQAGRLVGSVGADVPCPEAGRERLGDDQCRAVGGDGHSVREGDAVGHEASVTVRTDRATTPGPRPDLRVNPPLMSKFIVSLTYALPSARVITSFHPELDQRREVDGWDERSRFAGLARLQALEAGHAGDDHRAVRLPVEAEGERRRAGHDVDGSVQPGGEDLAGDPIGAPEPPVVPTAPTHP